MIRVMRTRPRQTFGDLLVYVGPWVARLILRRDGGRFGNGRRHFSGWSRWADQ